MRPGRVIALVIGTLLVIPSIGLLFGGSALGLAYAFARDDEGYFDTTLDRLDTDTVAVTAEDITLAAEPGSPDWLIDALDTDVRLLVTSATNTDDVFVGIARESDVDSYLSGIAHDEITDVRDGLEPVYRTRGGTDSVEAPIDQSFWTVASSGPGTQELTWEATTGRWAAVVMNADGSPGIAADVNVGVKSGFVLPLALLLIGAGAALAAGAVALIIVGASGLRAAPEDDPAPAVGPLGVTTPTIDHPVALEATLDPGLSRWKWLVKWILAIPHFIVIAILGVVFVVLTIVAGVAIVFTGRYPRGIFDVNVGVLRWSWRVSHYASTGGIGTDRYPPFSLHAEPGDPARLDIAYPEKLSRGLVFVKWLLAIPHLIIVALLVGSSVRWLTFNGDRFRFDVSGGGGLLGLLALVAGVMLLFTGRYPAPLFDLIVGLNRWVYRVVAYVALMTDEYPPFRLDQGGTERPDRPGPDSPPLETIDVDSVPDREPAPTAS